MNKKNKFVKIAALASILFSFSLISLTFAKQTETQNQRQLLIETRQENRIASGSVANANQERIRLQNLASTTDKEISKNTESLQNLLNRINNSQAIPGTQKNMISQKIQSQINNLENIKNQLGNNEISSSSIADQRKIMEETTQNIRLLVPQANILAAANRILSVATMTTEIANKLQIRISEMQNNGANVSSTTNIFNDISAKVADAQKMAQNAINESQNVTATSTTIAAQMKADTSALQSARADIVAGQKDLQSARKDIGQLLKFIFPNEKQVIKTASGTQPNNK
jgi:hypothetical protein